MLSIIIDSINYLLSYKWFFVDIVVYIYFLMKMNMDYILFNIFLLDSIVQAMNFIFVWMQQIYNDYMKQMSSDILDSFSKLNYSYVKYAPLDKIFDFKGKVKEEFHNPEYKINIIDKYIYFALLFILNNITKILFWNTNVKFINSLYIIFTLPFIYLVICKLNFFILIVDTIKEEIYKLYLNISCKLTALMINHLTFNILNSNPNVDSKELEDFYEGVFFNESIGIILQFIKTVFVLSTVHYYKKTKNMFYRSIISFFYNIHVNGINILSYKSNSEDQDINKKKIFLSKIVSERKWNILIKPKNIDLFFELYDDKKEGTFITSLYTLYKAITLKSIKFCTLLTLLTTNINPLTSQTYFLNICCWSIASLMFNYDTIKKKNKIVSILISILLVYFGFNMYACAFVLMGHHIIDILNRFRIYLLKKKFIILFKTINNINLITVPILICAPYSYLYFLGFISSWIAYTYYKYKKKPNFDFFNYYENIKKECLSKEMSYKKYFIISFILIGYLSHFSMPHLCCITYIYNVILNGIATLEKTLDLNENNMLNLLYVSNYMAQSMHKTMLEKSRIFEISESDDEDQVKYPNYKIQVYQSYF